MAESSVFKIALLQTQVLDNVDDNLTSCAGMVENAKLQGADIAVLPAKTNASPINTARSAHNSRSALVLQVESAHLWAL